MYLNPRNLINPMVPIVRNKSGKPRWGHKESDTTELLATMPRMGKLRLRGEKYVPGKGQSQDWNLDFLFQI